MRMLAYRYSGFSDAHPALGKDGMLVASTRSTSRASVRAPDEGAAAWGGSAVLEPLDFQFGPIDGSGRLSRLSFSSFFQSREQLPGMGGRLLATEAASRPQQLWSRTHEFPMPPTPVRVRNGVVFEEGEGDVPEDLGRLNRWLRENRKREFL